MGARYIRKHDEEFISKRKLKDYVFAQQEKKEKIQRPPAVYSNPQYNEIYSNEWAYYNYITGKK